MKRLTRRAVLLAFLSGLAMVAAATSPQDAESIAGLANSGNDGAQLMIALFYINGVAGYRRSLRLALRWARRAASSGNAYARVLAEHIRGARSRSPAGATRPSKTRGAGPASGIGGIAETA